MPGELKIHLIAQFKQAGEIQDLKAQVESFCKLHTDFKIERVEWQEVARRPSNEMMISLLEEIVKKLDEVKLAQEV